MTPPEEFLEEAPPTAALLPLHFDVEEHRLKISTLISGLQAVKDVVEYLNNFHFGGKLSISVDALPSKEGGFVVNIVIGVLSAMGGAIATYESETLAVIVEEFTGHPFKSEKITRHLAKTLKDSTASFFMISNDKLRRMSKDSPLLDKAIRSKSRFMRQCINDRDVRGLGFSSS